MAQRCSFTENMGSEVRHRFILSLCSVSVSFSLKLKFVLSFFLSLSLCPPLFLQRLSSCGVLYCGLGLVVLTRCVYSSLPRASVDLTPESFRSLVLSGQDHWVVDFYAPWCGPCQHFAPEFEVLARVSPFVFIF